MSAVVETVEWGGRVWRRYPESKSRNHRVYYQCHTKWKAPPLWLHREVWRAAHGDIPAGHDVHHRDENPLNNDIGNLECVTVGEHRRRHRESYRSAEQLEHLRRIRPRSLAGLAAWRKTPEGVEQLRRLGRETAASLPVRKLRCPACRKSFRTRAPGGKYCSLACGQQVRKYPPQHRCVCEWCKVEFVAHKRTQQFCARTCSASARESAKRAGVQPDGG